MNADPKRQSPCGAQSEGDGEPAERACRFLVRAFEASSHSLGLIPRGAAPQRHIAQIVEERVAVRTSSNEQGAAPPARGALTADRIVSSASHGE